MLAKIVTHVGIFLLGAALGWRLKPRIEKARMIRELEDEEFVAIMEGSMLAGKYIPERDGRLLAKKKVKDILNGEGTTELPKDDYTTRFFGTSLNFRKRQPVMVKVSLAEFEEMVENKLEEIQDVCSSK